MSNMVVRTNVLALNSHRNLGMVGRQQANASSRLSSGFRINSAADDAAGLGISEKMRAQIRGLDQASRNAQDGVSLIQTAEGAMSTINDMVVRIRELVVQAANDTNAHEDENRAQSDRVRIQDEINQLMDEIDATRNRTQFNTRNLIDGSLGGPQGAYFDQTGFDREMANYMNSSEYKDEVTKAGDAAVAGSTAVAEAANTLASERVNVAVENVNNTLEQKTLQDMITRLELEEENRDKAIAALDEYMKQLNGVSPAQTEVVDAITTMLANVSAALDAAVNRLSQGGIPITAFTYSGANFGDMTVTFNGATGSSVTMSISELATYFSSNTATGDVFKGLVSEIVKKLGSTEGLGFGAIQTSLNSAGNVVVDGGTWNGIDFGTALGTSQISYSALETFKDAMESLFDASAMAGLNSLIDRMSADNEVVLAAISGTLAAISSYDALILNAKNSVSTQQVKADAAQSAYDAAMTNLIKAQEEYDRRADAVRIPAEGLKAGELQAIHDALVRPGFNIAEKEDNALWFQVGANVDQGVKLNIEDVGTRSLSEIGLKGDKADEIGDFTFDRLRTVPSENIIHGPGGAPYFDPDGGVLNVSGEEIQKFITGIDEALAHVTGQRSKLGAMQNRLDYTMQNLDIASENLSASESRIRDADMAKEMMRLTQSNVLQQAATAMLAQANQAPQSVLQLLG